MNKRGRENLEEKVLKLMKNSIDPKFSVADRLVVMMCFNSIIDKVTRNFRLIKWARDCDWMYKIKQQGKNKILANHIAHEVCEDIEFRYPMAWIYEKLINGSYGNDCFPQKIKKYEENEQGNRNQD